MKKVQNDILKPLVIYHFPCPDGFGSAYAAWRVLGENAEYLGVDHDHYPVLDVTGRSVYILDFSFPRAMLETMKSAAKSLLVLDHHKTAKQHLEGFEGAIFDMSKSGARMTWEYFHPDKPLPKLLEFVEDRDLWVWRNPRSEDFLVYLDTLPFDFNVWHELAGLSVDEIDAILEKGAWMNQKYASLAAGMANDAEPVKFCGLDGLRAMTHPLFSSKIGALLYEKNGTFALLWRIEKGKLHVSLRARKDTVDVSEMALKYGGGGHAAAAAFRLTLGTPACELFMAQYIFGAGESEADATPSSSDRARIERKQATLLPNFPKCH